MERECKDLKKSMSLERSSEFLMYPKEDKITDISTGFLELGQIEFKLAGSVLIATQNFEESSIFEILA